MDAKKLYLEIFTKCTITFCERQKQNGLLKEHENVREIVNSFKWA